jgi:hypothetical protein
MATPSLCMRGFDARRSFRDRMDQGLAGCERPLQTIDLDQRRRCESLTSMCRCDDGAAGHPARRRGPRHSEEGPPMNILTGPTAEMQCRDVGPRANSRRDFPYHELLRLQGGRGRRRRRPSAGKKAFSSRPQSSLGVLPNGHVHKRGTGRSNRPWRRELRLFRHYHLGLHPGENRWA